MRHVVGTALVMSAIAGRAHAQAGNADAVAAAERLFDEARELAAANRWAEACPKFEASLRSDPALGTQLNLATCYEHVGKLARAWNLYRESIALAEKAGDVKRRDYARTHAAGLEPRLARVSITTPVKPPNGLVVRWDGSPIDVVATGVGLYSDAGRHELIASAPGFAAFTKTVALVEGQIATVAIPDLSSAVAAGADATPPSTPDPPVVVTRSTRVYVAIGLGGAGLVTAGVGLVFGLRARSMYSDATAACPALDCIGSTRYERSTQLTRDARSSATVSTVLVAAGGAAIAAAAVVYLTRPDARERSAARLVPVADDRSVGLAIAGRF